MVSGVIYINPHHKGTSMSRRRANRRTKRVVETVLDCTPERLAKGDVSVFVDPSKIDSAEQPIGRVRCFRREPRLDRWHKAQVIDQRQYTAGDQYRKLHQRAINVPRIVASYGERTTGGETDYGLARTAAQARARDAWRAARSTISLDMVGFLDRFLIHDALPDYRGRRQMRTIAQVRAALDQLAWHFEHHY